MTIKWIPNMSIFDHPSSVALVNPVNCKGVMGAGLAKEFKRRWPAMFEHYKSVCVCSLGFRPGQLLIYYPGDKVRGPNIICFPTKDHWREPSKLEYIKVGLEALAEDLSRTATIDTIALPKLGCGLGGLAWEDVRSLMIEYLEPLEATCYVHGEPPGEREINK
jgi:O-acetyl-ADP-ribose deacetylase (regulator of RNase III)